MSEGVILGNNINVEMMPFKKYCQAHLRKLFQEDRKWIEGCFKEKGSGVVHDKDDFFAHPVGHGEAMETYSAYISWFNHTRTPFEKERVAVSARWDKSKVEQ